MRKHKISEALGKINEKYVNEAAHAGEADSVRRNGWMRWGWAAACVVCVFLAGLTVLMPRFRNGAPGESTADHQPILVSIEEWQDEGFQCQVIDADIHEFLTEGGTLFIQFEAATRVTTTDGTEFAYDEQNPNAEDCGLPVGAIVKINFSAVEYDGSGMAERIYAQEVIPQGEGDR